MDTSSVDASLDNLKILATECSASLQDSTFQNLESAQTLQAQLQDLGVILDVFQYTRTQITTRFARTCSNTVFATPIYEGTRYFEDLARTLELRKVRSEHLLSGEHELEAFPQSLDYFRARLQDHKLETFIEIFNDLRMRLLGVLGCARLVQVTFPWVEAFFDELATEGKSIPWAVKERFLFPLRDLLSTKSITLSTFDFLVRVSNAQAPDARSRNVNEHQHNCRCHCHRQPQSFPPPGYDTVEGALLLLSTLFDTPCSDLYCYQQHLMSISGGQYGHLVESTEKSVKSGKHTLPPREEDFSKRSKHSQELSIPFPPSPPEDTRGLEYETSQKSKDKRPEGQDRHEAEQNEFRRDLDAKGGRNVDYEGRPPRPTLTGFDRAAQSQHEHSGTKATREHVRQSVDPTSGIELEVLDDIAERNDQSGTAPTSGPSPLAADLSQDAERSQAAYRSLDGEVGDLEDAEEHRDENETTVMSSHARQDTERSQNVREEMLNDAEESVDKGSTSSANERPRQETSQAQDAQIRLHGVPGEDQDGNSQNPTTGQARQEAGDAQVAGQSSVDIAETDEDVLQKEDDDRVQQSHGISDGVRTTLETTQGWQTRVLAFLIVSALIALTIQFLLTWMLIALAVSSKSTWAKLLAAVVITALTPFATLSKHDLARILRPRTPDHCIRVDWKCHCGTELYADYPNKDPDAVARLSRILNQPYSLKNASDDSTKRSSAGSQQPDSAAPPPAAHLVTQQSIAPGRVSESNDPSGNSVSGQPPAPAISVSQASPVPSATVPRRRYFELCVNTGRLCQSLGEIDLTRVTNDIELFRWIRKRYKDLRGTAWHRHFWTPRSVQFVLFGLEQRSKVHVLCKDDQFPPHTEVVAQRYHLAPSPPTPEGTLPMPSSTFIHYLDYCNLDAEHTPEQTIWFDRLPKKLTRSVMEQASSQGAHLQVQAWGVRVQEGLNMEMLIWTCLIVVALLAGPIIGAVVAFKDIQSAFAVVGLPVSVAAILLTAWLQVEKARVS